MRKPAEGTHGGDRLAVLASPAFVLVLCALLANDFLLKALLHDRFTGKLSDFAGLFVFTSLWLVVLPNRLWAVLAGVALSFIWWKSPLSQPAIHFFDADLHLSLHRVVDYSDLMALLVLPLAVVNQRRQAGRRPSRFLLYPIGLAAVFAITATSQLAVVEGGAIRPQNPQASIPTTEQLYNVIDAFAGSHGLGLVPDQSDEVHHRYQADYHSLETNYDPGSGVLYYGFGPVMADGWPLIPFAKRRADATVVRLEHEFVATLGQKFPALKPETGQQFGPYGERSHGANIEVTFPMVADVCNSMDRDLQTALNAVDEFAAEHHMRPASRGYSYPRCSVYAGHSYALGAPDGPYAQSFPLLFSASQSYGDARLNIHLGWADAESEAGGWMNELHDRLAALDWQDPGVKVSEIQLF